MWGCALRSERARQVARAVLLALAAGFGGAAAGAQEAAPPARVVSVNLCTDQLAMLVAAPGQVHSVSYLAQDPRSSAMAAQAAGLVANHGRAEEIYLMRPDLVLAGRFTDRATVSMLRRLGVPVVQLDPARALSDVPERLRAVGAALGRQAAAERLIADFEGQLAALATPAGDRPRAAVYYANGYTAGERSLAGDILNAAGYDNAAGAFGIANGGHVPLEVLALSDPDALITGNRYPGASRSEAILDHPVVAALQAGRHGAQVTDRDWVCGTPHVLGAIAALARDRPE